MDEIPVASVLLASISSLRKAHKLCSRINVLRIKERRGEIEIGRDRMKDRERERENKTKTVKRDKHSGDSVPEIKTSRLCGCFTSSTSQSSRQKLLPTGTILSCSTIIVCHFITTDCHLKLKKRIRTLWVPTSVGVWIQANTARLNSLSLNQIVIYLTNWTKSQSI